MTPSKLFQELQEITLVEKSFEINTHKDTYHKLKIFAKVPSNKTELEKWKTEKNEKFNLTLKGMNALTKIEK